MDEKEIKRFEELSEEDKTRLLLLVSECLKPMVLALDDFTKNIHSFVSNLMDTITRQVIEVFKNTCPKYSGNGCIYPFCNKCPIFQQAMRS